MGGGGAAKTGKNTHLSVIMRVRLSHKIGLNNLMNWNVFRKGNVYKLCTYKLFAVACGILIMLHTCILLLFAYNRRPTNTPGSMYKLVHLYRINEYCRYYTFEHVTNLFYQKKPLICKNFGCNIHH